MWVGAHIIQSHLLFSPPGLCLEEHGLPVVTLGAMMVFCPRQSGVGYHISHYMRQLAAKQQQCLIRIRLTKYWRYSLNFVHNFVHIDTLGVGVLFVVAISACI